LGEPVLVVLPSKSKRLSASRLGPHGLCLTLRKA
jgi:hypothetical protein